MGRRGGQTINVSVRKLIIQQNKNKNSLREISELINRSRSPIQYTIK